MPQTSAAWSTCGTVRCRSGVPVTCDSKKPGSRFCEAALREELRAASRPGHEGLLAKVMDTRVKPGYDATGDRHACRLAQLFRVARARPRMARPPRHPRHRSTGADRN